MDYFFKKYQDKWYIRDVAHERFSRPDDLSLREEPKLEAFGEEVEDSEKYITPSFPTALYLTNDR